MKIEPEIKNGEEEADGDKLSDGSGGSDDENTPSNNNNRSPYLEGFKASQEVKSKVAKLDLIGGKVSGHRFSEQPPQTTTDQQHTHSTQQNRVASAGAGVDYVDRNAKGFKKYSYRELTGRHRSNTVNSVQGVTGKPNSVHGANTKCFETLNQQH